MPVLNPDHLIEQANRLIHREGGGAPRQADLRRAVSSAYYSLFHEILIKATDDFLGGRLRTTPRYEATYRKVSHSRIRKVCDEIAKSNFPRNKLIFGKQLTTVAGTFINLQEKRHSADYAPLFKITLSDAKAAVASASEAVALFRSVANDRRRIFSALVLFQIK
jgi:uncharacterized protein (UPF0332 family)